MRTLTNRKLKKHNFIWTAVVAILLLLVPSIGAEAYYVEQNNTYMLIIDDGADLLTDIEETALVEIMRPVLDYGNVAYVSTDFNVGSTATYAEGLYYSMFGTSSGTLLLIDMYRRNLWIYSDGHVYSMITNGKAKSITDNSTHYATNGEYFRCVYDIFDQIVKVLHGQKISQPMKYISNALLALITAFAINYIVVISTARAHKVSDSTLVSTIRNKVGAISDPDIRFTYQTKRYNPPSSSGGGGGHGGGGGGHSGGGGGHHF